MKTPITSFRSQERVWSYVGAELKRMTQHRTLSALQRWVEGAQRMQMQHKVERKMLESRGAASARFVGESREAVRGAGVSEIHQNL